MLTNLHHFWEKNLAVNPSESLEKERKSEEPVSDETKLNRQRKGILHKLRWRAHWLLPNTVPSPHEDSDRAYQESRDNEENGASRVPEDEELRLPVIWGTELFGPAEAEGLYEHLARLKWSSGSGFSKRGDAVEWIRHQRSYGTGGGWYNISLVVREQDRQRWLMPHNFASLPDEVDYLQACFFQLTPSLTCALVGFVLKADAAVRYEQELNKDRKSIKQRIAHGWGVSILDPNHLKARAIVMARSELRSIVGNWFKANLPGYFCGRSIDRLPTAELLTTKKHRILNSESEKSVNIWRGWQRLISNASAFDVWTSASCKGLQMTMFGSRAHDNEANHTVVSLCAADVSDESVKLYGGRNQVSYARYCQEHLDGILSNYAAFAFLKETSKDIRSSRSALRVSKLGGRKCVRVLDQIQSFFDRSLGAPAVAAELRSRSERSDQYQHECSKFLAPASYGKVEQQEISNMLQGRTNWLATQVLTEEHTAREHFEQLASILSVRESVRAQRRMEWLTLAALFVATGSLAVAIPSIKNWVATLGLNVMSQLWQ